MAHAAAGAKDLRVHRLDFSIWTSAKAGKFAETLQLLDAAENAGRGKFTPNFVPVKHWDRWTALHWAAMGSYPDRHAWQACNRLLGLGWCATAPDRVGATPLMLARRRNGPNKRVADLLQWFSPERVTARSSSVEKRCRKMNRRLSMEEKQKKPLPVNHIVPVPYLNMDPDPSFQTFDQLLAKFRVICPNWKPPKSKYLP